MIVLLIVIASSYRRESNAFEIYSIVRISTFFILATAVGIGLIYRRKWAAYSFALANLSIAVITIVGSLYNLPLLMTPLYLLLGVIFLIPVLVTVEFRDELYSINKDIL